jgi:hypothetical protein
MAIVPELGRHDRLPDPPPSGLGGPGCLRQGQTQQHGGTPRRPGLLLGEQADNAFFDD